MKNNLVGTIDKKNFSLKHNSLFLDLYYEKSAFPFIWREKFNIPLNEICLKLRNSQIYAFF